MQLLHRFEEVDDAQQERNNDALAVEQCLSVVGIHGAKWRDVAVRGKMVLQSKSNYTTVQTMEFVLVDHHRTLSCWQAIWVSECSGYNWGSFGENSAVRLQRHSLLSPM